MTKQTSPHSKNTASPFPVKGEKNRCLLAKTAQNITDETWAQSNFLILNKKTPVNVTQFYLSTSLDTPQKFQLCHQNLIIFCHLITQVSFPYKSVERFQYDYKIPARYVPLFTVFTLCSSQHITLPWYRSISNVFLHIHQVYIILHPILADSNIKPMTSSHINYGPCNYGIILRYSCR